jgi:hypothetical protein
MRLDRCRQRDRVARSVDGIYISSAIMRELRKQNTVLEDLVVSAMSSAAEVDDAAKTLRFERFSLPYERIEIAPAPRTFAHTVPARTARQYEPAWFEPSDMTLARIDKTEPMVRGPSWWWLAISLAAAGAFVAAIYC